MIEIERVRQIIREATDGMGYLNFGGTDARWHPINDFRNCPDEAGLYAIGLPLGIQYHGVVSRIVYLGRLPVRSEIASAHMQPIPITTESNGFLSDSQEHWNARFMC